MFSKRMIKCVLVIFGIVFFTVIGLISGLIWGTLMAEDQHTNNVNDLSKTLEAISQYYDEMNEYPTDSEFYRQPICNLPLEQVTDKQVTLYSGVGGSHIYIIEFTGGGDVSISRR